DFAAVGSEQFLDGFCLCHHGRESRLARNSTFLHERAGMPQEFFQCGRQTKLIEIRKFSQKAGTASALTGWGVVDFNCCSSATTLLPSFRLRLVAYGASGSAKKISSSARKSGGILAKLCAASLSSSSACVSSFMRYLPGPVGSPTSKLLFGSFNRPSPCSFSRLR